ncbi:unnamed protein product [Diamesa serratosioi]
MIIECIEKIENKAPKDMKNLYYSRCDGSSIQRFLKEEQEYDFNQVLNPPCTLKYLLRIIHEPLLTYRLYFKLIDVVKSSDNPNSMKITKLRDIVSRIPSINHKILKAVMRHFGKFKILSRRTLSIMFGITLLHPPRNEKMKTRDYKHIHEIIELLIINHNLIVTTTIDDNEFDYDDDLSASSEDISESFDEKSEHVPQQIELLTNNDANLKVIPEQIDISNNIAANTEVIAEIDELFNPEVDVNSNTSIIRDVDSSLNDQPSAVAITGTFTLRDMFRYLYNFINSYARMFLSRVFNY